MLLLCCALLGLAEKAKPGTAGQVRWMRTFLHHLTNTRTSTRTFHFHFHFHSDRSFLNSTTTP
jgi:hypothetical protein